MVIRGILSVVFFLIVITAWGQESSALKLKKSQPKQGKKVKFTYNPAGTNLKNDSLILAVAYTFNRDKIKATDIKLKKRGSLWKGKYKPSKDAFGFYLKFQNSYREDQQHKVDKNSGQGYRILFHDNDKEVLPEAKLASISKFKELQFHLKLVYRADTALAIFKQEFQTHPSLKRPYISPYINALLNVSDTDTTSIINALAWLEQQQDLTEEELLCLSNTYKYLGSNKAAYYAEIARKKWPNGKLVKQEQITAYRTSSHLKDKAALFQKLTTDFPDHDWEEEFIWFAEEYARINDTEAFKAMLAAHPNAEDDVVYRSFANVLMEKGNNLDEAKEFILKAYTIAEKNLSQSESERPEELSEKTWRVHRENNLGLNAGSYGQLFLKIGNYEEALPYLQKAYELTQGRYNALVTEPYVEVLLKTKDYETAGILVREKIAEGYIFKAVKYKGFYKELYMYNYGTEDGFESYWIASTEAAANKRQWNVLQQLSINEPAPDFELKDLDGNIVRLSTLKGKVVVIDFWATWCGPCIGALQTMKDAIKYHDTDKDVVFLFVNTRENADNKLQKIQNYRVKYNMPFQTLLDEDNTVAEEKYKVKGLPTKLIIDAEGVLRFRSTGQNYEVAEALRELLLMIEFACTE